MSGLPNTNHLTDAQIRQLESWAEDVFQYSQSFDSSGEAISATSSIIGEIVGHPETARAQFAVRESLAAQRDVIKAIISILVKDTPANYELCQTSQLNYASSRPCCPAGAEGQREFAKINAMHDSLGASFVLLSNTATSLDLLVAALETEVRDPATLNAALDQAFEVKAAAKVLGQSTRQLLD
jgi:hypothetical protein